MSNNTGGPAFPAHHFDLAEGEHGMTLRDYFAAKAMQALIEKYDESPVEITLEAYEFADAMLKMRGDSNGS